MGKFRADIGTSDSSGGVNAVSRSGGNCDELMIAWVLGVIAVTSVTVVASVTMVIVIFVDGVVVVADDADQAAAAALTSSSFRLYAVEAIAASRLKLRCAALQNLDPGEHVALQLR